MISLTLLGWSFELSIAVALAVPGMEMATEWWTTLSLRRQLMYGGIGGIVGLLIANFGVGRILGVSLVGLFGAAVSSLESFTWNLSSS